MRRATLISVNAAQVEVVRALCEELATEPGVVYVACERRGGATLGEAGDRRALLSGPIVSTLGEELVPVGAGVLLRIVHGATGDATRMRLVGTWARDTIRRLLAQTTLPPVGGGTPPTPSRGGGFGPASAQISATDRARRRWN
jgi:hypothetical protein